MWPVARYVEFPHYRPTIISLHTLPRIPLLLALSSAILPLRLRTGLLGKFCHLARTRPDGGVDDARGHLGAASSPLNDWDLTVLGWGFVDGWRLLPVGHWALP